MSWTEDTYPGEDSREGHGDPRVGHRHRDDRPVADVLEQEIPVDATDADDEDAVGRDDDRVEPVGPVDGYDPTDWPEAESVEPGAEAPGGRRSA